MKEDGRFPDKKQHDVSFDDIADYLERGRDMFQEFSIGQQEAIWNIRPEYEALPTFILLMTDTHFGSSKSDTGLIREHLDIVEKTPNFYMVHNGDAVDNFNVVKHGTGMTENPLPPQFQGRGWEDRMVRLDRKSKIGAIGFGNHDDFTFDASQHDFYDTFYGQLECPIFTTGGVLNILVGNQHYQLAMTHKYWGTSKLNPTNAVKRFMEHEYPYADILLLGHTHQSEGLHFERGGKDRIGVIGGTYKDRDDFARKHGIGGRAGSPGWVVALWPDRRHLQLFKDVKDAQETFNNLVQVLYGKKPYIDPYTRLAR
jgi:predicted phosphodiesterase